MQVLEDFHDRCNATATEHKATIVARAGDGVMIVVNDPVPVEKPLEAAMALAEDLRSSLLAFCANWYRFEFDIGFGIGVSYGYATLGLVGGEKHHNYTAIGTPVNVAARLCDVASDGEVYVTQRIVAELEGIFEFEKVDKMELKGVSSPLNVFRLLHDGG